MFRSFSPLNILFRGILPILLITALGACGSIEYLDNDTLREIGIKSGKIEYTGDNDKLLPRQFGGFSVGGTKDEPGKIFLIKRKGKNYTAETILVDNTGVEKASFEKSYLSFGSDKKRDGFRLQLKFVY